MSASPLAKIKAIGFDLDGTLVNSAPGLAAAVDAMLVALGRDKAGLSLVSHWIGNGADVLVERALAWSGLLPDTELHAQARALFDKYYALEIDSGSQLYPNVIETLSALAQQGYVMALVTNKPTPFVAPLLEQLEISSYFSTIVGGDDVVVKKPHPAPIYLILARLGLRADELLFVGDSRNDIQAAKAAFCPTVGLSYGYNYGEPIAESQPNVVLDDFIQLLSILGPYPSQNETGK